MYPTDYCHIHPAHEDLNIPDIGILETVDFKKWENILGQILNLSQMVWGPTLQFIYMSFLLLIF